MDEKPAVAPSGHMYVNLEGVALLGRDVFSEPHRHFTASVTLALEGPFLVRGSAQDPWQSAYGMAARPNAEQQLDGRGALLLNMQVDPETESYARLAETLWSTGELAVFGEQEMAALSVKLRELHAKQPERGQQLWDTAIEMLGGPARGPRRFDVRIAKVLEILKAAMPEAPNTRELGEQVGLSEGRLIHLFSEQVGVPLRRYVLWLRIRHIVFCLAIGRNLTDAAHEAGFADSAHLTRVFRSMFGVPPSHFLRSQGVALSLELPSMPLKGPHAVQDAARVMQLLKNLPVLSK